MTIANPIRLKNLSRRARLSRKPAGLFAAAFLSLAALVSCVTNPVTGKSEFLPFMPSTADQVTLGLQAAPQLESQGGGKIPNAALQSYINAIGQKMAAVAPPNLAAGFKFSYTALNADVVNACALPGGPIFVYRGLLTKMDNEAQLAFVLGHETGHVLAQHAARQISTTTEMSVLVGEADAIAGGQDASTGSAAAQKMADFASQMYLLKYSRDEETQADSLGLDLMVKAGYDPREAIKVMQILDTVSGGSTNDWMQTHPAPKNRIQNLTTWINAKYPGAMGDPHRAVGQQEYHQHVLH